MARRAFAILHPPFSILVLLSMSGCNILGPVSTIVAGPPSVPAVYVPAKERMLIVVENFQQPSESFADAEMLARTLREELTRLKVAPLVPMDEYYAMRTERAGEFRNMSIAGIGKALGAKQVLYVDLQQVSIDATPGSDQLRGTATVSLRIVDSETGRSRWPKDVAEGYPLSHEVTPRSENATNHNFVRSATHRGLAQRIGRLFRKWSPENVAPE